MDRSNHHFHLIKHLHFGQALHDKFNDLVIADTFRLLALSIISIFIPIFLLKNIHLSMFHVVISELGCFILSILFHYVFILLTGKIGVKKIMIASYIFNIFTCLILFFGNELKAKIGTNPFVALVTFFNALPLSMYWTAHHVYFLESIKDKDEGRKLGILQSIPMIISIAGPFIGSVLISNYSFREVFIVSIFFLIAASVSLLFSDDIKIETNLSLDKIFDTRNFKRNSVFFLQGLGYCATSFVWPVLLFFASINLVTMGFFYLLSNFLNGVIVYLGGINIDKNGTNQTIKVGAVGHSISMILRALSTTMLFMATFQSMGGFFGGLLHVAIDTGFYKSSHKNIGNAIMNRELYMHLGRITTITILLLALLIFELKIALIAVLLLAGVATFLLLMVVDKNYSFMEESYPEKIRFSEN